MFLFQTLVLLAMHPLKTSLNLLFLLTFCNWLGLSAQIAGNDNPHGNLLEGINCSNCHTSRAWIPLKDSLTFNHNEATKFQLIGKHGSVSCQSCHVSLVFSEPHALNENCTVCHTDVHQGKLGTDCQLCHNQQSFSQIEAFAIHSRTSFPLTGAHIQTQCSSCHENQQNGHFTTLETDCYSCHKKEYENTSTKALDHTDLGYSTDCKQCHNTMGWANDNFDHITSTGFPLVGAHNMIRCQDCHSIPSMDLKHIPSGPNDCYSCHSSDYEHEHGGSSTPTTCLVCHNQNTWDDADFSHERVANGFELLGAHSSLDCQSCHILPSYQTKFATTDQNDCYSCHKVDYDREHTGTDFSLTCSTCHSEKSWSGASFADHDPKYFPIYSGEHRNVWGTSCQTCHTNPSDFKIFSCIDCHEHNKTEMDKEHRGESDYLYLSTACYSCHPRGTEDD